jgi:hypothetical protein
MSHNPVIMLVYLNLLFKHDFFSSVLTVPAFRFIGGKPFLNPRCSGLAHKATSTSELIR